jgi:hypothetical protein
MKKIYLLTALVLFCFTSNAQLTLTKANNEPVVGDVVMNARYDSTAAIPKNTGAGLNWNFTSLTTGSFTETTTYTTVASSPAASLFSNATIAMNRNSNNWEYWNAQAASFSYVGMAEATSTLVFSNQGVWNTWPNAFGNTNSDALSATETAMSYTNTWAGTMNLSGSGSGTVVLPNGNTHTNCLQVLRTITVNVSGTQPSTMTIRQYEYWSSLVKFPILTVEYSSKVSSSGTSKDVQIFVNTVGLVTGIPKVEPHDAETMIYPSPTSDVIRVSFADGSIAENIEIYDASGKLVLTDKNVSSVNVSKLDNGVYFIKATGSNQVLQRSFIKAN